MNFPSARQNQQKQPDKSLAKSSPPIPPAISKLNPNIQLAAAVKSPPAIRQRLWSLPVVLSGESLIRRLNLVLNTNRTGNQSSRKWAFAQKKPPHSHSHQTALRPNCSQTRLLSDQTVHKPLSDGTPLGSVFDSDQPGQAGHSGQAGQAGQAGHSGHSGHTGLSDKESTLPAW